MLLSSGIAFLMVVFFAMALARMSYTFDYDAPDVVPQKISEVRVVAVGDIMLDRHIRKYAVERFAGSYAQYFHAITEFAQGAVLFGNLEGPIAESGTRVGSMYSFRMDPVVWGEFVRAGFDVLSFANNHIGDYAQPAYKETIARAGVERIALTGVQTTTNTPPLVVTEHEGVRIGWLGYTDVGPEWMRPEEGRVGVALLDEQTLVRDIALAREQADVVMVSVHWGEEYATTANTRQRRIARAAIDAGAHVVLGHHPHVAQEVEEYNGGVIAYSLGNYIFDQNFSPETGFGLVLDMTITKTGVTSHRVHRATFDKNYIPTITALHASP